MRQRFKVRDAPTIGAILLAASVVLGLVGCSTSASADSKPSVRELLRGHAYASTANPGRRRALRTRRQRAASRGMNVTRTRQGADQIVTNIRQSRGGSPGSSRRVAHCVAAAAALALLMAVTGCSVGADATAHPSTSTAAPTAPTTSTANPPVTAPTDTATEALAPVGDAADDPHVGDCWTYVTSDASYTLTDCALPHTNETTYVLSYTGQPDPPSQHKIQAELKEASCDDPTADYLGSDTWGMTLATWRMASPGRSELAAGAAWIRCDIQLIDAQDTNPIAVTGTLKGALSTAAGFYRYHGCYADRSSTRVTACNNPHIFEAVLPTVDLSQYFDELPSDDDFADVMTDVCRPIVSDFVGAARDDVGPGWTYVSESSWAVGNRTGFCLASTDAQVVGSLAGIGWGELPLAD